MNGIKVGDWVYVESQWVQNSRRVTSGSVMSVDTAGLCVLSQFDEMAEHQIPYATCLVWGNVNTVDVFHTETELNNYRDDMMKLWNVMNVPTHS